MSTQLFSLEGKTAVVTGASRGIGRAIALGFAEAVRILILNMEWTGGAQGTSVGFGVAPGGTSRFATTSGTPAVSRRRASRCPTGFCRCAPERNKWPASRPGRSSMSC